MASSKSSETINTISDSQSEDNFKMVPSQDDPRELELDGNSKASLNQRQPSELSSGGELDKLSQSDLPQVHVRVSPPRQSHIPKPQISPKPDFLMNGVKKEAKVDDKLTSTSNILKNTLKRMSRLSLKTGLNNSETVLNESYQKNMKKGEQSVFKKPHSMMTKSYSGTSSRNLSQISRNGSLRRSRASCVSNMPSTSTGDIANNSKSLQRSGTNSTLERRRSVNNVHRSNSVASRRNKTNNDQFVKKSRSVQTQLTRDILADELAEDEEFPTSLEFTRFMPSVLGTEVDQVETHPPNDPIDVRRNRALTLENMRLSRELERLKSQVQENEHLKRDLRTQTSETENLQKEIRTTKLKLEEEVKSRLLLEKQLDQHNQKVKMIAESMDTVESEFMRRDSDISTLEKTVQEYKESNKKLQTDLNESTDMINSLQVELERSLAAQRILIGQYREAEEESKELHEFLQAEKMTLVETMKEYEREIKGLKLELEEQKKGLVDSESRITHLVRLSETRHQENLALEAKLNQEQEKSKFILISQGAEISRANICITDLLEKLRQSMHCEEVVCLDRVDQTFNHNQKESLVSETQVSSAIDPSLNNAKLSFDLTTVPVTGGPLAKPEASSMNPDSMNSDSSSLRDLSLAITMRQMSENGHESLGSSNSLPSLVEKIGEVQLLVEKCVQLQKKSSDPSNEIQNNLAEEGKENIDINGKNWEEEMQNMKTKYLKHRQILLTNCEEAEKEIKRMDEVYHETIDQVLKALSTIPEIVSENELLQNLQKYLELTCLDESGKSSNKNEISKLQMENQIQNQQPSL